jgi:hypothetical protein
MAAETCRRKEITFGNPSQSLAALVRVIRAAGQVGQCATNAKSAGGPSALAGSRAAACKLVTAGLFLPA